MTYRLCTICEKPVRGGKCIGGTCSGECEDIYVARWYAERLDKDPLYFLRGPEIVDE